MTLPGMVRKAILPLITVAQIGCGPGDSLKTPVPESPVPVNRIKAVAPTLTMVEGDRTVSIHADQSELNLHDSGKPKLGTISYPTGEVKVSGKTVSRFTATNGTVDQDKKTLLLTGNVKITDETRGLLLTAREVKYGQLLRRYEAKGDVWVTKLEKDNSGQVTTSEAMRMGPLPVMWANEDLDKIATPKKFND
ncbi:MAG: hypothetical protein JNM34_00575 [Chthonomonadaceae bacterium]|nr:hypothetical protein [Chthonomonadaceae bacterium]